MSGSFLAAPDDGGGSTRDMSGTPAKMTVVLCSVKLNSGRGDVDVVTGSFSEICKV